MVHAFNKRQRQTTQQGQHTAGDGRRFVVPGGWLLQWKQILFGAQKKNQTTDIQLFTAWAN